MNTILKILQSLINRESNSNDETRTVELTKIEGDPNHLRVTVRDRTTGAEIYSYKFVVFNEKEVAAIKSLNQHYAPALSGS
jgi:hypothetical protein